MATSFLEQKHEEAYDIVPIGFKINSGTYSIFKFNKWKVPKWRSAII